MSRPQMDNQKFSGLIKVNISRDTNDRQLIVNEKELQKFASLGAAAASNASDSTNARKSPINIVRTIGEPVLPAKKPRQEIVIEFPKDGNEKGIERAFHDFIEDDPASGILLPPTYQIPDFVAGNLKVPEDQAKERLGVETIFPNVCFHFLNDNCVEGSFCPDSHTYPPPEEVHAKLNAIGWENAAKLFRVIISRCYRLRLKYFVVFTRFFARKRQRGPLLDMLAIVEDPRNKVLHFLPTLMKAFAITESTKGQAIALIMKHHRRTTPKTLSIIFDADIISVSDILNGLELMNNDPEFSFDVATVNHLLTMSGQIGTIAFVSKMVKIFDRLKSRCPSAMTGIDQDKFKRFIDIYEKCTEHMVLETSGRPRISAP